MCLLMIIISNYYVLKQSNAQVTFIKIITVAIINNLILNKVTTGKKIQFTFM